MTLLDDVARAIAPEYFTKSAKKLANYTGDNPAVERDSSVVASCQATALRDARAALQTVAKWLSGKEALAALEKAAAYSCDEGMDILTPEEAIRAIASHLEKEMG